MTRESVATRFGGFPTVEEGETWPLCDGCAGDLTFVAQVDYSRDGLHDKLPIVFFTFFYCWVCHPWGQDREKGRWLVRSYTGLRRPKVLVQGDGPAFVERHAVPRLAKSLPDGAGMHLHCRELWDLVPGESGSREAWANWDVVDRAALRLTQERAPRPHMRNAGVAIGGYPYWVNGGDKTPVCTQCTRPMELLLQIRPSELTDADWGDVGTLYLFMCRKHTQRTGLRIQCT
ncbi:DUF1963 domain-containing protein [Streptomyces sp. ML-6]|uniref:DUF1963 domain-containing protein n=1 Tax=Streptomyces sp. ML-6 TaxID=2982693 RepID=UPI0024C04AFD|nr:DUF1963 domain-containing protein [Streptomyces sp. ML-6]MDK0524485.1 DUF1963 domain-containing protein [Streptomyces sp. ML-6]